MNGRIYDYNLGRFMSVDPFIQAPTSTQSVNPYSYIMNNPLAGTDPTGYACEAATGSHICKSEVKATVTQEGSTVKVHLTGGTAKQQQAVVNAIANGASKMQSATSTNVANVGSLGENAKQGSGNIGITGEVRPIQGSPAIGFLKSTVRDATFGIIYGDTSSIPSLHPAPEDSADMQAYEEQAGTEKYAMALLPGKAVSSVTKTLRAALPTQIHHFATNKSKVFTPAMEKIAEKYGLKLDYMWNKEALPHLGRHPNPYHQFVLDGMKRAHKEARGDVNTFLTGFDKYVKQPVLNNPELLRKSGWK